jgi:hypothetical protein
LGGFRHALLSLYHLIYSVNIVDITAKGDAPAGSPHDRIAGGILLAESFPLFAVVIDLSMPAHGRFLRSTKSVCCYL